MKIIVILIGVFFQHTLVGQDRVITLDQVVEQVKNENYLVLENAEKIYQAKETINFNKRNLLPKLNIWNVLKLPFDWGSAVDIVQDLVPFLVPSNWFRVKESELFYLAGKEQYRALWANQLMTAKLLYINTLRDIDFIKFLNDQYIKLSELIEVVESKVIFGENSIQTLNFLKIRRLELAEDISSMERLIYEEKKALAYALGISQEVEISLSPLDLVEQGGITTLQYEDFVYRAINSSPEVKQYEYLKDSIKYIKKEAQFSFLGSSTSSRGVSGGVFDSIPIQDGLGFGVKSTIRISKSHSRMIDNTKKASEAVIKKNLKVLLSNYNSLVDTLERSRKRLMIAQNNYASIKTKFVLGSVVNPLILLESIDGFFDASISFVNKEYEILTIKEKITRAILNGDYSKKEGKLEEVLK